MNGKQIIFSMVGMGKVYPPNKQVLRDIYLSFLYGAKIGVLGLNGDGKSTLLRIIAASGWARPPTGRIGLRIGSCDGRN